MTIKTRIHLFSFDVSTDDGKAAWEAFRAARKADKCPAIHGPVLSNVFNFVRDLDGAEIELETAHLFDNQWNTAPIAGRTDKGLRVFDWALQAYGRAPIGDQAGEHIRRGHWLEQTAEMRELRRNTHKCGYCGRQEPAAKGYVFCPHCIGSEYLKESELHLTRMLPVAESTIGAKRAPLTKAESAHLLPLYRAAQIYGATERDKARIAAERQKVQRDYDKAIRDATVKRDGFTFLMDRGIRLNNVIYYDHTARFCFGWRKPLSEGELSTLLSALGAEFPSPYDIKCEDGRTLSGE